MPDRLVFDTELSDQAVLRSSFPEVQMDVNKNIDM